MNCDSSQTPFNSNYSLISRATVISTGLTKKPLFGALAAMILLLFTTALSGTVVTDAASDYQFCIPLLSWTWLTVTAHYLWHWLQAGI